MKIGRGVENFRTWGDSSGRGLPREFFSPIEAGKLEQIHGQFIKIWAKKGQKPLQLPHIFRILFLVDERLFLRRCIGITLRISL
jgi:hypothetical protein